MSLVGDLETTVAKIFRESWSERVGTVVPEPTDVGLGNDAVLLEEATVLYADLAESTDLVDRFSPRFAAEIYKTFLHCAARVIVNKGGSITAYDGDRVMAVFIGNSKNTDAAKAALNINHAVLKIIQPKLEAQYPKKTYTVQHCVGIDTSKLLVARTGVRGNNDLVWVGRAANYAAKLSALRVGKRTIISADVYNRLKPSSKFSNGTEQGENMWTKLSAPEFPDIQLYSSTWYWPAS